MTVEAAAYVWRYSPYRGVEFLLHLTAAELVDHTDHAQTNICGLATKARTSIGRAGEWVWGADLDGLLRVERDDVSADMTGFWFLTPERPAYEKPPRR